MILWTRPYTRWVAADSTCLHETACPPVDPQIEQGGGGLGPCYGGPPWSCGAAAVVLDVVTVWRHHHGFGADPNLVLFSWG